jgi:hypothetical protein
MKSSERKIIIAAMTNDNGNNRRKKAEKGELASIQQQHTSATLRK